MENIPLTIFLLITSAAGLISSLTTSILKKNRRRDLFLALALLFMSLNVAYGGLILSGLYKTLPSLIAVLDNIPMLIYPLLYIFYRYTTSGSNVLRGNDLLHFIPYFMLNLIFLPFFMLPGDAKIQILETNLSKVYTIAELGFPIVLHLYEIVYLFMIFLMLKKSHLKRKNSKKMPPDSIFKLLTNLFIILLTLSFLKLLPLIFHFFAINIHSSMPMLFQSHNGVIILIQLSLFLFIIYKTTIEKEIFFSSNSALITENGTAVKYDTRKLDDDTAAEYLRVLDKFMREEKPYRDSTLVVKKLSEMTGIQQHQISQIINDKLRMNFYNFVNRYRIDEVKTSLLDPTKKDENILSIAFSAGFKSKSSFNTIFKKETGITPNQFRKNSGIDS